MRRPRLAESIAELQNDLSKVQKQGVLVWVTGTTVIALGMTLIESCYLAGGAVGCLVPGDALGGSAQIPEPQHFGWTEERDSSDMGGTLMLGML